MSRSQGSVNRKIRKVLPDQDPVTVQDILDQYGVESYEKGRARVQLAILKVFQEGTTGQESGEQKLERLRGLVRAAKCDYRDVLAWAEYPEQIKMGFIEMKKLTPQEGKALRKRDREQYLRWLNEP
jgi:hypothetical protein